MSARPEIDRPTVMFVYGTRPEAIKMAPLVQLTAQSARLAAYVVVTGQHRAMLDQVNEVFGIIPDADLDIFEAGQGIESIVAKTLTRLTPLIREVRPAAVVVQGDTSTAFAAAQAAFYCQVPIVHLEAGLRTNDLSSPFPEEANRQLIGRLASLHLAPTARNRNALIAENLDPESIAITGNTVIDALKQASARIRISEVGEPITADRRRRVLVTLHRRENLGDTMGGIARALARIAKAHPDVDLVVPLNLNPAVRTEVVPALDPLPNVTISEPLAYTDFVAELTTCDLVVSDSGGVQEEGPGLGKPVLVVRNTTERPEAVEAGTARLIGTDEDDIVAAVDELLTDPIVYERMATAVNPYGDGLASPRCLAAIEELLGVGRREPDFIAHEGGLTRRLRHLTGLPRTATRTKRATSA